MQVTDMDEQTTYEDFASLWQELRKKWDAGTPVYAQLDDAVFNSYNTSDYVRLTDMHSDSGSPYFKFANDFTTIVCGSQAGWSYFNIFKDIRDKIDLMPSS